MPTKANKMRPMLVNVLTTCSPGCALSVISKFINFIPGYVLLVEYSGRLITCNTAADSLFIDMNEGCRSFFKLIPKSEKKNLLQYIEDLITEKIEYHEISYHCPLNSSCIRWTFKKLKDIGVDDAIIISGTIIENSKHNGLQTTNFKIPLLSTMKNTFESRFRSAKAYSDQLQSPPSSHQNSSVKDSEYDLTFLERYGEEEHWKRQVSETRRQNYQNAKIRNSETNSLKDILELKKMFVRGVAHEIRSPLNVVMSGLELLQIECKELQNTDEIFEDIKFACTSAIDIVGDFISYEKIESNIHTTEKIPIDFYALVEKCNKPFFILARNSGVKLEFSKDGLSDECFINGDEHKLSQVIRNLVSNAIKFSAVAESVHVHVFQLTPTEIATEYSWVRVEVTDSGPGISIENQKKLFKDIVQFNARELQGGGGSGIGLWLSRRIVDQHGGHIGVHSAGEGTGCVFFAEFPVVIPPSRTSPTVSPFSELHFLSEDQCYEDFLNSSAMKGFRILIVDDASMVRKMTSRLLLKYGIEVSGASDGVEALSMTKMSIDSGNEYHAIFMDSEMKIMHGPEAAFKIRTVLGYTGKIFGITGNARIEDIDAFIEKGADRVFVKPITKSSLYTMLKDVVEKKI